MAGNLIDNALASLADPAFWTAVVVCFAAAVVLLVIGTWVARLMHLLPHDATDAQVVGIGLAIGLVLVAAVMAAILSMGRSAYVPVALALTLAVIRAIRSEGHPSPEPRPRLLPISLRSSVAAAAFLSIVSLLFAATVANSPSNGMQPVAFMDEAFYSILGRDLLTTGIESWASPAGFGHIDALPYQLWYHWGEIWLSGLVDAVFPVDAMFARHLVVLPILLLAVACLIGSMARALRPRRRPLIPFVFGAAAALTLAPIPNPATFFAGWPSGLLFGITTYGLAAVVAAALINLAVTRPNSRLRPAEAMFVGAFAASLLPSHVLLALLGVGGVAAATAVLLMSERLGGRSLLSRSIPIPSVVAATACILVVTAIWGVATGHGLQTAPSPTVEAFNADWRLTIVLLVADAGVFLLLPIAWLVARKSDPIPTSIIVASCAIMVAAAILWGSRVGDLNTFHFLFGGMSAFGVPAAVIAVVLLWDRLRRAWRPVAIAALYAQMEIGAGASVVRLQSFGPHDYPPIPLPILDTIRSLEPDAKLAYRCRPMEELAIWDSRLLAIDAHTGRRIVPLCFEAFGYAGMTGGFNDPDLPSPFFAKAPQLALFPTSSAKPAETEVLAFMKTHGIRYIWVDKVHPNDLVPNAIVVAASGSTQVLRVP